MGLGTNHRLSLAQNPVLLAGQIAIILASCNRDVARLCKRRQVAGREEVRAGDSESRAEFGRTLRAVRQPLQDVVRHLGTALSQKPSCFVMLLIIDQTSLPQRADHFDPKTSPLYPKDPMSPPQRPYVFAPKTLCLHLRDLLQRKLHQSSTTGKKINKSEFLFYLLLSHLHFTFFTAQKIHLSCALPSDAFPFLLPNRLFDTFRFTNLFFHLKPRLFYSHTFTAKFSYKFLFGGKVEFILGGKNAIIALKLNDSLNSTLDDSQLARRSGNFRSTLNISRNSRFTALSAVLAPPLFSRALPLLSPPEVADTSSKECTSTSDKLSLVINVGATSPDLMRIWESNNIFIARSLSRFLL